MNSISAIGTSGLEFLYSRLRRLNRHLYQMNIRYSEEDHRREFMRRAFHALHFNGIGGDYVEFGSHGATTFALAHAELSRWPMQRILWAFDSFAGLPPQREPEDYHPGWKPGKMSTSLAAFSAKCRRRGISPDTYRVVPGYYEETLAPGADEGPRPDDIAVAFVDCDLYSSTKTVLDFLKPRLKQGMIIAFDDYYCFSARTISGERRACLEAFPSGSRFSLLPYFQFGWHGMSFVVEDAELLPRATTDDRDDTDGEGSRSAVARQQVRARAGGTLGHLTES